MEYSRNIGIAIPKDKKFTSTTYNKIKVGNKILRDDVVLGMSDYQGLSKRYRPFTKEEVEKAILTENEKVLRAISRYFFRKSGIYSRLCNYMANLFRYDWYIVPIVRDEKIDPKKIIEGWYKASLLLENCSLKHLFSEIGLKVLKNGCYYGYKIEQKDRVLIQELPVDYCRSRYKCNGLPAVEFNLTYFDKMFVDSEYRLRVLKLFPKEVQKAYVSYKKGRLEKDFISDEPGWFLLDVNSAVKFNLNHSDIPMFVSIVPHIIDLDDAQDLDKQKMMQQVMRIIIQQFPINKNGDLIFDMSEMQMLHNNAVEMLGDAIGVDVLSTVADVEVADMSDKGNVSSVDQLEKVERTIYNEAGVSQMQFNTNGNIALEKSIVNDESTMISLLYQFQVFAENLLKKPYNKNPKRLIYKVQILPTTGYNYKELAKLYKEQTMLGFSKLLPQVALGQTQSSVIATAIFENKYMNLADLFIAPQMSSTISKKDSPNGGQVGRPPLDDSEKAEKTLQNIESQS